MSRYFTILLLLAFARVSAQEADDLSCEQLTNPEGIDVLRPRLGWQFYGNRDDAESQGFARKDVRQTAWQVIVASSEEKLAKDVGDLWNSGKVMNDESVLVGYAGVPLKSRMVCYWKVKVWTNAGVSGWSKPAHWSMGLLQAVDWKGKWIGYEQGFAWDSVSKFSRLSARYFRKTFAVDGIRKATLYIAGLGHYTVAVNGKAIGDQVLAQAPTDYTKSVSYNTYDVTKECSSGENVLDVVLGNGRFFTMRPRYKPNKIKEFGFPKLLLQLEITDEKGERKVIVSDTSWRFTADGPIRSNNEYDGEEYDATKELGGWMRPQLVEAPGGRLVAQMNPPIMVMKTIKPVGIKEGNPGVWILDMGQNMAGWVQMTVRGLRGEKVVLRYAETLKKDGSLYTANLRDAKVTDIYTLKGDGEEVWHPVFVFHGFRYVEISGYPGRPVPGDFEGQVVYDDLDNVGNFYCSDTILNALFRNAWWGINSNYKGMPVDCPQRNERMPWLGDRATGSLGESYLFRNDLLYAKWLEDIEESQKPDGQLPDVAPAYWNYYSDNMTWPGVYILIADMLYNQYGDLRPVQLHYASMKKWLHYMSGKYEKDGIITKDKYGDWCVPPESPDLIHSKDSTRNTDGQLIATAYYYHLLGLMREFAELLHMADDGAAFAAEAEKVRTAFNKKFFVWDHYSNNTVTANLLPLYFGMVPDGKTKEVFKNITDKGGHISTGVIGTQWLMRGLTRFGGADLAYRIASNTDYPSWGYMVEHGATTIWELWNGDSADPAMNSQNHIMLLGDLLAWMFQDLAGIAPAAPGFKRIRMKPVFPAGLDFAKAYYNTPYGPVSSSWNKKDGVIIWDVIIPVNVRAQVYLPDGEIREIGSGTYHFEAKLKL